MAKVTINQSVGTVEWIFDDGSMVRLHRDRLSQPVREYAVLHGIKQKAGDAMALSASDFGGRVPDSARKAALVEMVEYLESGATEWNQRRAASGTSDRALLVRALAELGKPATAEWIKARSTREIEALLASERIKPIADRMRAEAVAGVDTEELLAGL